ncbi:MAG: ABC transporter permease, partial [Clostridia bacterium]|nr:ABC transporter permease [Clostridia bacterium]
NLSLIGKDTLFAIAYKVLPGLTKNDVKLLIALGICLLVLGIMRWFFKTHLGLCIRATGNNMDMVRSSSINVDGMKILALSIANGCVGLSGAVLAQYQGYADIGSGVGIVVIGLASVIIGEVFFGRRSVGLGFFSAVIGAILYRIVIAVALKSEIFPAYALKLVSAGIVAAALSLPALRQALGRQLRKRKAVRDA